MFHTAIHDNRLHGPAFVGPYLARQIELEIYLTIGSTAVLLWDIILHAPEDYKQIRKQGFLKLSRIVYCFSRFITLFYMVGYCVLETVPIGNCAWIRYIAYISPLVVPITLLLFLFRVYALFRNRSYVLVFIFISWLLVFGSSIAAAVRIRGVRINETGFCMNLKKLREKDLTGALPTITRFSHDTLVFAITSWWLYQSNLTSDRSVKDVVCGLHRSPLARSLLQDGQAYYLATLALNIVVIALYLLKKPIVTPCGNLHVVLINNMASHVYRNLVNAKYRDHSEFLHWVEGDMDLSTRPGANV